MRNTQGRGYTLLHPDQPPHIISSYLISPRLIPSHRTQTAIRRQRHEGEREGVKSGDGQVTCQRGYGTKMKKNRVLSTTQRHATSIVGVLWRRPSALCSSLPCCASTYTSANTVLSPVPSWFIVDLLRSWRAGRPDQTRPDQTRPDQTGLD
jgi:hypothetical protein